MQSHHQSIYNPFSSVFPHELKRWTLEAIAHGAKGLIYWKWNNFQKGLQTFGRGLIDSSGKKTGRALVAEEIGRVLDRHADAFTGFVPQKARAAILYDRLCHDYTKSFTLAYAPTLSSTIYTDSIAGVYKCFWEEGVPLDVVTPANLLDGSVSEYRALFLTGQLNLSGEMVAALAAYVSEGGTAIMDGKLGEIGNDSLLWAQAPGGGLSEILGYGVGDMHPDMLDITLLPEWEPEGARDQASHDAPSRTSLKGFYERRDFLEGSVVPEVIGRFADGAPAMLRTPHGKGEFLHLLTLLWYGYAQQGGEETRAFARSLAFRHGWMTNRMEGTEVRMAVKTGSSGCLLFLFNDAGEDRDCRVQLCDMPEGTYEAVELFTGRVAAVESGDGSVVLSVRCGAEASDVYRIRRL